MKRQQTMTLIKYTTTAALLLAVFACRPSASDNYLFDTSTDQIKIDVVEHNKRMTFKAPAGKKITKIRAIATAKERVGKFTPGIDKKYVSMFSDIDKPVYDIELTLDADNNCRTATNGVTLTSGGSFNVGCVSQSALVTQLKTACKELAVDTTLAVFDETKDSCSCLKRTIKTLKYSEYLGRANSFKLECKNSATVEQLKTFCTEIKDRQCPTCIVEAISCQCPRKVTLSYDKFLTNVEDFRSQCENPVATVEPKPIDSTLTTGQALDLFETECKKFGAMNTAAVNTSCKCSNGLNVELDNWKKNQKILSSTCTDELVPENAKPDTTKPDNTKPPLSPL